MNFLLKTTNLTNNIWLHEIENTKFKTNKISINFVNQFIPQNASLNTALALMLVKQCEKFPSIKQLGQKLKDLYGADLSSNCIKFGDLQIVHFSTSVIKNNFTLKNENLLESAFDLLCEIIFKPKKENETLSEKAVEIEKQNLIELISNELSQKQKLAQINAVKLLFKNENCGYPPFGSIDDVKIINKNSLTTAYENLLKTSQIHLIFSTNTNNEALKNIFLSKIKNLNQKAPSALNNNQFVLPANFQTETQIDHDEIMQSKLILGFATKNLIDTKLIPAIKLMTAMFGATPTSKLFSIVREKLSLCYYCAASFNSNKKVIWVSSGVDAKKIELATKTIVEQLNELKNGNFSEQELNQAKRWLINNLRLTTDDIDKTEGFFLEKILNKTSASTKEEIENLEKINSNQIVQAANFFHHALTYAIVSKN